MSDTLSAIDSIIIGQKLGNCLIENRIGRGGMASVYRAIRDHDESLVAVKVISQDISGNTNFVERFKREADLMLTLDHPNILPVYDFGSAGELMYIVMKLIDGGSLDDMLEHGRLPLEITLKLLEQIASALDYAHERKIIHRDLKPGNVLLDVEGNAYLTDFGIAKWKEETTGLTLTGMVIGTPGYMSPEQWRTEPVDARTDVYALGVMTFKMLTGQLPFRADTPFSLMYKHLDEPPPDASAFVSTLEPSIDHVLRRSMSKLAEQRYQSTLDFMQSMRDAASGKPITAVLNVDQEATALVTQHDQFTSAKQGYSAIDVGARTLLSRGRETLRETQGEQAILVQAVLDYIEFLRERAKAAPQLTVGPYKALESYDIPDNRLFFGREKAIDGVLDRAPFGKLSVLHAESGAGKTSLIRAGLMPRLLAGGYLPLYVPVRVYPPDEALKRSLLPDTSAAKSISDGSMRSYLRAVARTVGENREIFVFFDQFETFFTDVFSDEQRQNFINELADCLDDSMLQVRVVLAMRTEYFGLVASFQPTIPQPFEREFLLRRLTREEAERALALPAEAQGYAYEEGLISTILDDLADENNAIAPPQLQLVGTALIERLPDQRKVINHNDYQQSGGAKGVLGSYLKRILEKLPTHQRQSARLIIESLVRPDQTRDVKSVATLRAELANLGQDVSMLENILNNLRESHVLRYIETDAGASYELVHDYLALQIELDAETAARKAAQELLQRRLGDYQQYQSLLTEEELSVIAAHEDRINIDAEARAFIDKSHARLRWQKRRTRFLIGATAIGVIGVLLIGLLLVLQENENQREQNELLGLAATENAISLEQESRRLAVSVEDYLSIDPMVALNLALEAVTPLSRPYVPEAEFALGLALQNVNERLYLASESDVTGAYWLDDDQNRALVWTQNALQLIDTSSRTAIILAEDPIESPMLTVAINDSQDVIAAGLANGDIYFYNLANDSLSRFVDETAHAGDNTAIREIVWDNEQGLFIVAGIETTGSNVGVSSLWSESGERQATLIGTRPVMSPDHQRIATADNDGNVFIWNLATNTTTATLETGALPVNKIEWQPESNTLFTWSFNGTIQRWDAETGEMTAIIEPDAEHGGLKAVDYSPLSDRIALLMDDGYIAIWRNDEDAFTFVQEIVGLGRDGENTVQGLQWSPSNDQELLVFGTGDSTQVLNLETNRAYERPEWGDLLHEADRITAAEWSPSGTYAVLISDNDLPNLPSQILVWDVVEGSLIARLLGHREIIREIDWNIDETELMSSGGRDRSLRIWTIIPQEDDYSFGEIKRYATDDTYPAIAAWNPAQTRIAAGYSDGSIQIWDVASGEAERLDSPHTAPVDTIVWSADGRRLAVGGDNGRITVWEVSTGSILLNADHNAEGQAWEIRVLEWYADDTKLISGADDGFIYLWDLESGEVLQRIQHGAQLDFGLSSISISTDGTRLLASGDGGRVRVYHIETGELLQEMQTDLISAFGAKWSRDESQILVWGNSFLGGSLSIFDAETGEIIVRMDGHSAIITEADWSPDETRIVSASQDQSMRIWDAETGENLAVVDLFGDTVSGVQWVSANRIITYDRVPTLRIWEPDSQTELYRALIGTDTEILSAEWSSQQNRLLLAVSGPNEGGAIRILTTQVSLEALVNLAENRLTRSLSIAESRQFFVE